MNHAGIYRLVMAACLAALPALALSSTVSYSQSLTQTPVGDPDLFTTQSFSLTFTNVPTQAVSDATVNIDAFGDFSASNFIEYLSWDVEGYPFPSSVSFNTGGNDFQSVLHDSLVIPLADLLPLVADGSVVMNFFVPADVEPYALDGTPSYVTATLSYSAVPVPPAIWLMGSGMLGLVSVARRKSAQRSTLRH